VASLRVDADDPVTVSNVEHPVHDISCTLDDFVAALLRYTAERSASPTTIEEAHVPVYVKSIRETSMLVPMNTSAAHLGDVSAFWLYDDSVILMLTLCAGSSDVIVNELNGTVILGNMYSKMVPDVGT
jgi:hypothetical protein